MPSNCAQGGKLPDASCLGPLNVPSKLDILVIAHEAFMMVCQAIAVRVGVARLLGRQLDLDPGG